MRTVFTFSLILLVLAGCQKSKKVLIKGVIPDSGRQQLVLARMDVSTKIPLDSVKPGNSGKFRFSIPVQRPGFYQLSISDGNFISLLAQPGEKIFLRFNDTLLADGYEVSGSAGSQDILELDAHLRHSIHQIDSLKKLYNDTVNNLQLDSMRVIWSNAYDSILKVQKKYSIGFILDHLNSLASIKALYQMYDQGHYVLDQITDLQYMKLVSDSLSVYYPDSKYVKALAADFKQEYSKYNLLKKSKLIGNKSGGLPVIALPDVKGDTIKLSSLKGKYVLLTFWASWNKESVNKNVFLKQIYKKYHKKGLEIYQVSLDTKKENWLKAIQFDELPWYNVCDFTYPNSTIVQIYNVSKIPINYLLNKEGTVINRDLDDRSLKIRLEQIFGN